MDIISLVKQAIEKAGSTARLAEEMKVTRPAVEKWETGTMMRADTFVALLSYLGGKTAADRALPDYEPESRESILNIGRVTANSSRFSVDTDPDEIRGGMRGFGQRCAYWSLTQEPLCSMEVVGDSMEPRFPDGCHVLIRRPAVPIHRLPFHAPVILRRRGEDEGSTLKLLEIQPPYVLGIPINKLYPTVVLPEEEAIIDWVAITIIAPTEPSTSGVLRQSDPPPAKRPFLPVKIGGPPKPPRKRRAKPTTGEAGGKN